jgi:3-deoxy-D-manno-octulosonic-acid transferase
VGEAFQALPVIQRLNARPAPPQLAFTWYSPSVEPFTPRFAADYRDYLAFDTRRAARVAVESLRPAVLVFSKLDVWPVLSEVSSRAGVRLGLISGTLSPRSGRRKPLARAVLRDAYRRLDLVGAITQGDAERLVDLGVDQARIRVTGDTRFDQVWERLQRVGPDSALLERLGSDRPTLVAGSTWPEDERHLLPAWDIVRRRVPGARLIVAPHEPTGQHLQPIEAWAASGGLRVARLSAGDIDAADVVLVDSVGVLGEVYCAGQVALVGGGFGAFGLHSVLEPAAAGLPVLHGPRWGESPDAGRLIATGGSKAVAAAQALADAVAEWLADPAAARAAGDAARAFVRAELGAAERAVALVDELSGAALRPL